MKVTWKDDDVRSTVKQYFCDLEVNEAFRIVNCEAVYVKIHKSQKANVNPGMEYMYEVATGNFFLPTNSPVERVDVTISINLPLPRLYNKQKDHLAVIEENFKVACKDYLENKTVSKDFSWYYGS